MSEIRIISKDDHDVFAQIFANAYPGIGIKTEDDIKRMKQRFFEDELDPRAENYGLFRDDDLLGIMRLYDFQMNLLGNMVLCGGLGSVAVDLAHKKEHVALELVRFYLDHYLKKKAPMATLWPFRPDFYRAMGFGYGTRINQYRIRPSDLPACDLRKQVRPLIIDDITAVRQCSDRVVRMTNGMVQDCDQLWRRRLGKFLPSKFVAYEAKGQIKGYMIYEFEVIGAESFIHNNIKVNELVYENRDAHSALLGYLHTQADQIERVIINTTDDLFHFVPHDLRDGSGTLVHQVYHRTEVGGVGIMYRILDVKQIFNILGNHSFGGQSCRLAINLTDNLVAANAGRHLVKFENGRAKYLAKGAHDVEITLDISEFSSLLMGAVNFRKLYEFRLAEISDLDYLDTVNMIFATADKPVTLADF